jgi:GNAT superfamily N-acetyltransferase
VINAHSLAAAGTRRALVDDHGVLTLARYVPGDASWAVADGGAAFHVSGPPHVVHEIGVFGSSRQLLEWAEGRAQEDTPAPEGARVVLQSTVLEQDRSARSLLVDSGYAVVRTWTHLEIELDAAPPEPLWPEGVSVRPFDPEREWPAVGAALDEAFVDHWGYVPADEDDDEEDTEDDDDGEDDPYSNSRDFCFVAWAGGEVAGVLLGNECTVEWPDSGKVGSVSVRRPFRRRGLATALLLHAFAAFHGHGIRRVITDTDSESFTAGPALYERVGMRQYRHELVYEKEVRPGRELRALSSRLLH